MVTRDGAAGSRGAFDKELDALCDQIQDMGSLACVGRLLSVSLLEVNLSRQVVYLARQGVVLRILDASSGKASTPTPTGNFTIARRIDGWRQSSPGLLWRPNYFYRPPPPPTGRPVPRHAPQPPESPAGRNRHSRSRGPAVWSSS